MLLFEQLNIILNLINVRGHTPEMYKNEWEIIGTGQTIYTVSNTTQFGIVSFKVNAKLTGPMNLGWMGSDSGSSPSLVGVDFRMLLW
jgi:hypothetical protein